jgi:hypothetical protein
MAAFLLQSFFLNPRRQTFAGYIYRAVSDFEAPQRKDVFFLCIVLLCTYIKGMEEILHEFLITTVIADVEMH